MGMSIVKGENSGKEKEKRSTARPVFDTNGRAYYRTQCRRHLGGLFWKIFQGDYPKSCIARCKGRAKARTEKNLIWYV